MQLYVCIYSVWRPVSATASAHSDALKASLNLVQLVVVQVIVVEQLLLFLGELDAGDWNCCAAVAAESARGRKNAG